VAASRDKARHKTNADSKNGPCHARVVVTNLNFLILQPTFDTFTRHGILKSELNFSFQIENMLLKSDKDKARGNSKGKQCHVCGKRNA